MEIQVQQTPSVDGQTVSGTDASRSSGDLVRRVVWSVLALYLAPAVLLVLLVGGLAMGILVLIRILDRIVRGPSDPGQGMRMLTPLQPHIGIVSGMAPHVGR